MSLTCITNQMDDVRSCTVKGEHQNVCDGWQYHYDSVRGQEYATGRECKGCQPREAKKGLLCWGCWEAVQQAFADWTPELRNALYTHDRLVQRDNAGVRSQTIGYVNLPGTLLAANEIWSYVKSCTTTADLWVCTEAGATDAVHFAHAVPVAKRTHEIEEQVRKVRKVRCPKCKQLQPSLLRKPPEFFRDAVKIVCETPECGKEITDEAKVLIVAAIENPGTISLIGPQAVNLTGDFAEPYDPDRPEHAELDPLSVFTVAELREFALRLDLDRVNQMRKTELIEAIHAATDEVVA